MKYKTLNDIKTIIATKKGVLKENFKSALWYVTKYKGFRRDLSQKFGIENIRPYKFLSWHHNCNYFIGEKPNKEKIFIKTGGIFNLIQREFEVINYISNYDPLFYKQHLPQVELIGECCGESFIAVKFIEGKTLDKMLKEHIITTSQKKMLLEQFIESINLLHSVGIVHRDIRPANIIITGKEKLNLVVIDFAFSVSVESNRFPETEYVKKNKRYIYHLGDGFNPSLLTWDDAYSFRKIALLFGNDFREEYSALFKSIEEKIGKLVYKFH
ncbi:serine/threonine protein kinase [Caldalkalibacillus uzonensis]|uniref:Serine/threonine protein kinase n=1 Tax=Caldalkalibacillus uzonensis TaxID=353224 RepID=A0ABU0CSU1_9BACI|nr:protein kinase [Caldalkalibacillus uzonensis]MDQ0339455.1 serine/threonine protein kinase [Caldalkalibacillus uzonensis]